MKGMFLVANVIDNSPTIPWIVKGLDFHVFLDTYRSLHLHKI